ncbi:MAG: hypothetical protein RJB62_493 [Pseudomonadota bacterium]|jgi:polar amino acid transport system substrate-binding protein
MRVIGQWLAMTGAIFLAACSPETQNAATPAVEETATAEAAPAAGTVDERLRAANLAPTGTLRAVFLSTNPIHARINETTGEITGPAPDITHEIARRIDVPVILIPAGSAGEVMETLNAGNADIGFLAWDATRAEAVSFAAPFALMESSYLVAADAPFQSSADAEAAGNVIAAVARRSQEMYLSGAGREVEIRVLETEPDEREVERLLTSGEIDAFGFNRQSSIEYAQAFPTLRVVDDSFFDTEQNLIVRNGETEKLEAINALAVELKANGFFADALQRGGVEDGTSPP